MAIQTFNESPLGKQRNMPKNDGVMKRLVAITMRMPSQGGGLRIIRTNARVMLFVANSSVLASFSNVGHPTGRTGPGINLSSRLRARELGLLDEKVVQGVWSSHHINDIMAHPTKTFRKARDEGDADKGEVRRE